jgi:hypothetical protein
MSKGFSPAQKKKTDDAVIQPMDCDIAWAAGFLEGEGAFQCDNRGALLTHASQAHSIDPLLKLHRMFGGSLCFSPSTHCLTWFACGSRALDVLQRILPLMGSRRSMQIQNAIKKHLSIKAGKPIRGPQYSPVEETLQSVLGITAAQEEQLKAFLSSQKV